MQNTMSVPLNETSTVSPSRESSKIKHAQVRCPVTSLVDSAEHANVYRQRDTNEEAIARAIRETG